MVHWIEIVAGCSVQVRRISVVQSIRVIFDVNSMYISKNKFRNWVSGERMEHG